MRDRRFLQYLANCKRAAARSFGKSGPPWLAVMWLAVMWLGVMWLAVMWLGVMLQTFVGRYLKRFATIINVLPAAFNVIVRL